MVALTLRKMAAGGMWDHVGGGFHRYSVDEHFHGEEGPAVVLRQLTGWFLVCSTLGDGASAARPHVRLLQRR